MEMEKSDSMGLESKNKMDNYNTFNPPVTVTPSADQQVSAAEEGAEAKYKAGENRRMLRNVYIISIAFTLLFTAYSSMSVLQSSLHPSEGLGNWASSVVYASMVISALFVPTAFIRVVTVKWAIFISIFGYTTFIAAQFHPRFWTLLPAGAIVGICAAPLWIAKCTYLTHVGNQYAALMSDTAEVVIVRFFGIFFMAFQTHAVFGNIISSTILSSTIGGKNNDENGTKPEVKTDLSLCGANFCPGTNLTSTDKEDSETKVFVLAGIYLAIALLAAGVIGLFVDSLKRYGEKRREDSIKMLLVATFRQMRRPYQILIIPLTIWSGLEQGFLGADYTAAYITCGWGVENVGYVLICYGLADSLSSLCYSPLVRYFGRVVVFFGGAALNLGLIIGLLTWMPSSDEKVYFFVFAALWGVADSCWQCGINAYYGVIFPTNVEASFSNYRLWESIGFVIAFAISNLICVDAKLYLLLSTLGVGMLGFSIIEICEWRRRRSNNIKSGGEGARGKDKNGD